MKAWKALLPPLIGICHRTASGASRSRPLCVALLRPVRGSGRGPVLEPLPGGRRRPPGPHGACDPGEVRPVQPRAAGQAWLSAFPMRPWPGPFPDFPTPRSGSSSGLHVRNGLREDRSGPAHRPRLGEAHGRSTLNLGYAVLGADLLLAPSRPPTPPAARHHLPGHPVPAALVRFEAQRSFHAPDRHLPHVGGDLHHLCDQHPLHDRPCPNVLAVELVRKTVHVDLQWLKWLLPPCRPASCSWPRCRC